eukprot:389195-Rhodomonas_salina.1
MEAARAESEGPPAAERGVRAWCWRLKSMVVKSTLIMNWGRMHTRISRRIRARQYQSGSCNTYRNEVAANA